MPGIFSHLSLPLIILGAGTPLEYKKMKEIKYKTKNNELKKAYRAKIEELQRMLNLYSDVFYHIKTELLWENGEIDLNYWVDALKNPIKIEEYDEELREIKSQIDSAINEILSVSGFVMDNTDGIFKRTENILED